MTKKQVTIVGSGNWGTAIARIVGKTVQMHNSEFDDSAVKMWVFEEVFEGRNLSEIINEKHENVKYLPGKKLPTNVIAVTDVVEASKNADVLVFVIPHQFLHKVCEQLKGNIKKSAIAISLIKGLATFHENDIGLRLLSNEISTSLGIDTAVLMGANLANEVAEDHFCEATIGTKNPEHGNELKKLFHTDNFRINVVEDAATVELCGALKNIVACGAGFSVGLGYGDNTMAAIIRIGLMDMIKFIELFYPGANLKTFFESCGFADLLTTCMGGRNRRVCEAFVKSNRPLAEVERELLNGQSAQGPLTAKEVFEVLQAKNLTKEFPFFVAIHKVCSGFKPQIGLEIHAQINSSSKLFSDAISPASSSLTSNSVVSAFDLATPGTLPTLNRKCVEKCLLAAVLLNCEIADVCRFDRKHYFYPDLPLGYQITQKTCPIARNGNFNLYSQNDKNSTDFFEKSIKIEQLQLEMDSGKTLRADENDLVDLNRAGVGLVEIVTAPDLANAFEATLFVEQLRRLLMHNDICTGHFHEGHFRVDVNVSVSKGETPGKRTELKNLSSLSLLSAAIGTELRRQMAILRDGGEVEEETRAVDVKGKTTTTSRAKGSEMDYRFMPEPNLPRLNIDSDWVKDAKRSVKRELFFHQCVVEFGYPPSFAIEIMNDAKMETFIRHYTSSGKMFPNDCFFPWLEELRHICDWLSADFPPTDPIFIRHFADLIAFNQQKRLTKLVSIQLLKELGKKQTQQSIEELIDQRQLWQITDPAQIRDTIHCVFEENPEAVTKAKTQAGGRQFVKLRREVLVKSDKRIDPTEVDQMMTEMMSEQK
ncbi:hypothetical protein niasHT_007390 [Heterodera trifolii]|uniref:Glutamyl-tRNA(Gln) amidotransferase subunit B, mitochondrial n=1 Tax=Heterodera trifolii TaxID=157864 RepID=A0ABD2LLH2_9BILA